MICIFLMSVLYYTASGGTELRRGNAALSRKLEPRFSSARFFRHLVIEASYATLS